MKAEGFTQYKEAMGKEVDSFEKEKTFESMSMQNKPEEKSMTPFVWSFKRKHNPIA